MVSTWATENQLVLGQRKVDDKSNEITAVPQLLKLLDIQGCIVTLDAINAQTKIAQEIVDRGGDYILAVKENQGHLHEDMYALFEEDWKHNFKDAPYSYVKTVNKDHGRIEIRQCWVTSDPEYLASIRQVERWPGIQSLVMIVSERRIGEEIEVQARYLHIKSKKQCREDPASETKLLEDREPAALGAGYRFQRRSQSGAQG
jgi:predicted transposase YbfD/YdcC